MAKKTPEINSSSTADIAFLLLCYFLMTTTMGDQSGLQRRLPPIPDKEQAQDQKVNRRNIVIVRINSADKLFAGNEAMDIAYLKDKMKEFLANPNNDGSPSGPGPAWSPGWEGDGAADLTDHPSWWSSGSSTTAGTRCPQSS